MEMVTGCRLIKKYYVKVKNRINLSLSSRLSKIKTAILLMAVFTVFGFLLKNETDQKLQSYSGLQTSDGLWSRSEDNPPPPPMHHDSLEDVSTLNSSVEKFDFADPPLTPLTNTSFLICLRFPKCSSTTTRVLFRALATANPVNGMDYLMDFSYRKHICRHQRCPGSQKPLRETLIEMDKYGSRSVPTLFSSHSPYYDYRRNQLKTFPLFMSIVRDPLERLMSKYYHFQRIHRIPKKLNFDECVKADHRTCVSLGNLTEGCQFFGGKTCQTSPRNAVEMAKTNIMKDIPVIGLSEHYTETLEVLENIFPQYFTGLTQLFTDQNEERLNIGSNKIPPKNTTIAKMRNLLAVEYELYSFIKQRFFKQYLGIFGKGLSL